MNYLVISALGKDRPGIVNELSMVILDNSCNIVDSRMSILGGEFAIILMVSGESTVISRLEATLPAQQEKLGLVITARQTEQRKAQPDLAPYSAEAVAIDHPGIVYKLTNFFSTRNINIEDLNTETYAAAHTGTPMFAVKMTVGIPKNIRVSALREQFQDFCDELNIDATIEPLKR